MGEPTFTDKMQALVAKELADAHDDPERMGEAIERLTNSLALVLATAAHGDPTAINTLTEGASAHLFECATRHARLAAFFAAARPTPGKGG